MVYSGLKPNIIPLCPKQVTEIVCILIQIIVISEKLSLNKDGYSTFINKKNCIYGFTERFLKEFLTAFDMFLA